MNTEALSESIFSILKTIYDPEIPVNLVDLGLIYAIKIENDLITIQMTLTNPNCPVAQSFPEVVRSHVLSVADNHDVMVELVWDPPWTPDRMTEAAKLQLGLL